MGCSRQNVKSLAMTLKKNGFIKFVYGANNSVLIEITDKANEYLFCMAERQNEVLNKLFSNLTDKEVEKYFDLQNKLLDGLEKVEEYANYCKGD